jgi:hypothetical protein
MFHYHTGRVAALAILLSTAALPQTGLAASYLDTVQRGAKTTYTASLAELTQAETSLTTRTLDWQRPTIELYFDLPPAERTSEIVLTLSADPLTRVAKNAPLEIQFNNAKPVPVRSNGRGFEARLPFNAAQSRGRRNVIRITYPTPEGADCVAPAHGAWSVDLSESKLRMAGRAQRRHMSLTEVSESLAQPALSPNRVGLIASGPQSTDMQALAAQGISLRTPGVPSFSVSPRGNDFNVTMVKRSELYRFTDDPMILNSHGARIFVPRGRPTELIFTADTDDEILQMLKTFTIRKFPNTSRPITSLGEIDLQKRLDSSTIKIEGKTALMDLAIASDIAPGAQSYRFGVADPIATSGEVLLRLSSMNNLSEKSRLRVALNGKVLGAAKLDKKRKSVAFDILPGTLNATSNVLNLVPDLEGLKGYECPSPESQRPSFAIGDGSKIILQETSSSPVTELSTLTSTGGLFAQSESYIALPKNTRDYQAALRVLGRMAKSTGHGLTLADYTRGANVASDKHLLIIGPANMIKPHVSGAPKALKEAMAGQSSSGENLLEANFESYASAGGSDTAFQIAARQSKSLRITRGGFAALYGSGNGNLTGVISTSPGQSFAKSSASLVELNHWNALQGGVSRWTSNSVFMTQTAQPDSGIRLPDPDTRFELPEIGFASVDFSGLNWERIGWPDLEWPDFEMPQVSLPDVNLPKFELPEFNWPSFKSAENLEVSDALPPTDIPAQIAKVSAPKTVKMVDVAPTLKPMFGVKVASPQTSQSSGLRGPYQFVVKDKSRFGSFQDIRRSTKAKWSASKRWFKSQIDSVRDMRTLNEVAQATDRLQDRAAPAGRSLKASLKDKIPGKGLVQLGDRTVSVYGLILIMAFLLVLLLMTLSKPASRLGGRH